jgi:hypothetical protein
MIGKGSGIESTPTAQDEAFINSSLSEIPPKCRGYLFDKFVNGYSKTFEDGWEIAHYQTNKTQKPSKTKIIFISPPYFDGNNSTYQIIVKEKEYGEERVIIKVSKLDYNKNRRKQIGIITKDFDKGWSILPSDQNPNDLQL